ncbi:phage head morphogenesis protein [Roseinatronobacter sp. NSM]|uniref:phage head morphogenesis protein n=1 Tax=Roseinatronobacter sp. NSM TaxID=3457785 RepID=UPI0040350F58
MVDRPAYSFNPGPPPEASRFLANKDWLPAFSFEDVEPQEHATAFTVAKAMQMDVLKDIREELQRALDEGIPLDQFQRNLRPRLEARGWWGKSTMIDPVTGEARQVQLGSPRRLRVIYQSNLRAARAAGQWERIQRTKRALPYLEYRLGPSERHRPHHQAKEGMILLADDPFWASWYPPNGWGCKCWVRQLTRAQAEERGISASPEVPMHDVVNTRTGEVRRVPIGIDPGWERNPGAQRVQASIDMLQGKAASVAPEIARVALRDLEDGWMAERARRHPDWRDDLPFLEALRRIFAPGGG